MFGSLGKIASLELLFERVGFALLWLSEGHNIVCLSEGLEIVLSYWIISAQSYECFFSHMVGGLMGWAILIGYESGSTIGE